MRATTRKAFADVTSRKGRTILVILGILVGVMGLTAVNVSSSAIASAFAYSLDQSKAADLDFTVQSIDPALRSVLLTLPNVTKVQISTVYQTRWQVTSGSGHVPIEIVGYTDLQHMMLGPFQLTSGRYPGQGEIVLEASDTGLQHVAIGDTVSISTPGGNTRLRVVGLARTLGLPSATFLSSAMAYMHNDALQHVMGPDAANNTIQVQLQNKAERNRTARQIVDLLHAQHVTVLNTQIVRGNADQAVVNGLFAIMDLIAVIAIVLTCFLIVNTISTLMAEQTKIIGTLKAIGGTRLTIIKGYLLSVGLYGLAGSVLGIGLGVGCGYLLASYLATMITLDLGAFQLPVGPLLISGVVGLLVPLLAALLPLWSGTRITVYQAMAAYGVSNNGKQARVWGSKVRWIPQTVWMGVRSIFRKRGRALLTLLALAVSGAVFLSVQTTNNSIDVTMQDLSTIYNIDMNIRVRPTPYNELRLQILQKPGIARIERTNDTTVTTHAGTLTLIGLEPDTHLYRRQLLAGRWFHGDEPGVLVISDLVAGKTGLQVGDRLTFSNATSTVTWMIIGEVHDLDQSAGQLGSAITTIDDLNTFMGLPVDMTSQLMVQAQDRSQSTVNHLANQLDSRLTRAGLSPVVKTWQQNIQGSQAQFQVIYILFYAVAVIVALVGMLGLFNTLSTSVLERRREIGILRSMGASSWRVASVFWVEGTTLTLIAWGIGVVLGIPGAYGFVKLLSAVLITPDFAFNPLTFVTMLVFVMIIATLASVIPTLSASRMRITDTLRYE